MNVKERKATTGGNLPRAIGKPDGGASNARISQNYSEKPRALSGEADEAHLEAAGGAAGAAPREEKIVGASGARADAGDRDGIEARALELKTKDRAQIEVRLAGAHSTDGEISGESFARAAGEAGVSGGAGDFATEGLGQGGVHLETAKTDRGT